MAEQLRFGRTWVYHNRGVDYQTETQIQERVRHTATVAEQWKTICENSLNQQALVALQRVNPKEWWLICARREGVRPLDPRPKIAVHLAELTEEPRFEALWGWMQAFRQACNQVTPTAIGSFPKADPEVDFVIEDDEQIARVAISLALLRYATISPEQLGYLDSRWIDIEMVPWILSCEKIPGMLPKTKGLIVSKDRLKSPQEDVELLCNRSTQEIQNLKLPQLMRCREDENQRLSLIRKALRFHGVSLEDQPLNLSTLLWMQGQRPLRHDLFDRIQESQLAAFLPKLNHAEFEELHALKSKLNLERDRQEIIRLLSQQEPDTIPHRFQQFLQLFPEETQPPTALLSAKEQEAWAFLRGEDNRSPERKVLENVFFLLHGQNLQHGFILKRVAWAVKNRVDEAKPLFRTLLREKGLPDDLIEALLGSQPLKVPLEWPPALEPHDHWLRGISAHAFLALKVGTEAETWWFKGIDYFVLKGELAPDDLVQAGCERLSLPLLERAQAPESVLALLDSHRPCVEILETLPWPTNYNPLLEKLLLKNRLWSRLKPPLSLSHLQETVERLPTDSIRLPLLETVSQLGEGKLVDLSHLSSIASLLESSVARQQLPHLLSKKPFPRDLFGTLLDCWKGEEAKVAWLRGRCLTGQLSPMPNWSVADMVDFFPLLDPVNDILLVVLNRSTLEDREDELLARLVNHFQLRPPVAVGYHPQWVERRPKWIKALAPLLGWPLSSETSP